MDALSSLKNRNRERDGEMKQTRKGQQWHFGMKAHIGADAATGPAHSAAARAVRCKAQVRAKVEHPFLYVKRRFGYAKVRYRGLAKNRERLSLLFGLANLLIAERYATA